MTDPAAQRSRIWIHPLFLLLSMPVARGLMGLSFSDLQACLILVAASAAGAGALLYLTCRNLGLAIRHSLLVVALFASSSTFMFWWSIPETFPFAGAGLAFLYLLASRPAPERQSWTTSDVTIFSALSLVSAVAVFWKGFPSGFEAAAVFLLTLVIFAVRKVPQALSWVVAGVLAIGVTLSNFAAALIATFLCRRFRDFAVISTVSFLAASWLAIAQNHWAGNSPIFFYSLKLSKSAGVQSGLGAQKHLSFGTLRHIALYTVVSPLPAPRVERQANKLVVASTAPRNLISGPDGWIHGCWLSLLALGAVATALKR